MELEYEGRKAEVRKDGLHLWTLGGRKYVNYIDFIDYVIENDELKVLEFELGEKQIIVTGIFE